MKLLKTSSLDTRYSIADTQLILQILRAYRGSGIGYRGRSVLAGLCLLAAFAACQPKNEVPTGTPVAKYGEATLTAEALAHLLPSGLSQADSQTQAKKHIDNWLRNQAILDAATSEIPGLEAKVNAQAEAHKLALASYYYGEYLAQTKVPKTVSAKEISGYYNKHETKFIAEDNYYAFFHVQSDSRPPNQQVALMRSSDRNDIIDLGKWARAEKAIFKLDSSWSAEPVLAGILDGSYLRPRSLRLDRTQTFRINKDGKESHHMIKLIGKVNKGERLPLSYCREQIGEIILTQRKKQVIGQEEAKLLQKARSDGKTKRF